jgi:lysophospholipase L1-like esterase
MSRKWHPIEVQYFILLLVRTKNKEEFEGVLVKTAKDLRTTLDAIRSKLWKAIIHYEATDYVGITIPANDRFYGTQEIVRRICSNQKRNGKYITREQKTEFI